MMKKLYFLFWVLSSSLAFAQEYPFSSKVDSTHIRIGSEVLLTIETTVDTTARVRFPEEKYFGALEVLESYPTDTLFNKKDLKYQLIKKYGLTQFDSGTYVIPSLKVLINNKTYATDSFQIHVANVQVDTLKQPLYDIKDIQTAGEVNYNKWFWIIFVLALVGVLGYFGYQFYKHKKSTQKKEEEKLFTPIEKATLELKKLEERQLLEHGQVKEYYSDLTNIIRVYFEEAIKLPARESTSSELIVGLQQIARSKKIPLNNQIITDLDQVLKQADLVKFAKSKPLDFEIIRDRNTLEQTIQSIHNLIPEKTPEELEAERNEELRIALEQKKRRKKIISNATFAASILLVVGLAYWLATSGLDTIKNKFFASSTTEFLTSEWITSEYGDPPIKIETPLVLMREQAQEVLPAQIANYFKEGAIFTDGDLSGEYFILVATANITGAKDGNPEGEKPEDTLSLEQLLELNYTMLELKGATNILMQHETFKAENGLEGIKAYGSLQQVNKAEKSAKKMYYEILIFKQNTAFQQVMIFVDDADPNKKEIIDRVIHSVELGQAK